LFAIDTFAYYQGMHLIDANGQYIKDKLNSFHVRELC